MIKYARGGYAADAPLSFWQSPLSPVGDALGVVVRVGVLVKDARDYLVEQHSLSFTSLVVVGFASLLAISVLFALFIVALLSCCESATDKDKTE